MSTHRISIDTTVPGASVIDIARPLANDVDALSRIGDFIRALANGNYQGKVRWNGNAVQAAGTITFASFADSDTITVNGVTLTGKTTPSGTSQFAVGASNQACANNCQAKIAASALDKIVGVVNASRRATVLIASMVAGDTVIVNGVTFTCTASPDGSDRRQYRLGTTDAATADNLKQAISDCAFLQANACDGIVVTRSSATLTLTYIGALTVSASAHATVNSDIVVVTCLIPGQIGNLCTLAISAHGSVSAANLASGTEGTEVIFAKNLGALTL